MTMVRRMILNHSDCGSTVGSRSKLGKQLARLQWHRSLYCRYCYQPLLVGSTGPCFHHNESSGSAIRSESFSRSVVGSKQSWWIRIPDDI